MINYGAVKCSFTEVDVAATCSSIGAPSTLHQAEDTLERASDVHDTVLDAGFKFSCAKFFAHISAI